MTQCLVCIFFFDKNIHLIHTMVKVKETYNTTDERYYYRDVPNTANHTSIKYNIVPQFLLVEGVITYAEKFGDGSLLNVSLAITNQGNYYHLKGRGFKAIFNNNFVLSCFVYDQIFLFFLGFYCKVNFIIFYCYK